MRSRPTLERELHQLLGTGRDALIVARYYGFDGRGGRSLQAVGNEVGLTRERVRQIVDAASESLGARSAPLPALDRTLAFVADRLPAAAHEIEAGLRSERLTSGLFRLEGVVRAAELLGRSLPFSLREVKGERLVVDLRDIPSVDTVVRIARRAVAQWGMTTLSNVVAEAHKVEPGAWDSKIIQSALACLVDFRWLDQSSGWFWLSGGRNNRVWNRIGKILSVANPIDISVLRAGLGRDYRMKGFSPPARVLLEFCRQMGLRVQNETVKAEPQVDPDDVLTQTERELARVLSQHGGTMAGSQLKSVCLGISANRATFYRWLLYSPIISKRASGRYGLIGSCQ